MLVLSSEGVELQGRLDVMGNLIACTTPLGVTNLEYDDDGLLREIEYADGELVKITHLLGAGPTQIDNGIAVVESWYDTVGQITRDRQGDHESHVRWVGGQVSAIASDVGLGVAFEHDTTSASMNLSVGSADNMNPRASDSSRRGPPRR